MFGRHLPARDEVAMIRRHRETKTRVRCLKCISQETYWNSAAKQRSGSLLLVRDMGYTVASRVVLHRGSGAVLLPRDQAPMLEMLQLTRSGYNNSLLL